MTGLDIFGMVIAILALLVGLVGMTAFTITMVRDCLEQKRKMKEIERQEQRQLLRDLSLIPYGNFAFRFPDDKE